ncbi:hypothetical protein COCNU_scaffold003117G000010 [Cocos nucifera]|nr:hypothetical protein [Cocos nucifera]
MKMASKKVKCKTHPSGSNASKEDLGENPFHNREIVKELIDGCTLVEVVDKIIDANPDQQTWDSLGSFLKMGHQLIANIKVMNHMRSEVVKIKEDHQAETSRLLKEKAKVESLLEKKTAEIGSLQKMVQSIEHTLAKAKEELNLKIKRMERAKTKVAEVKEQVSRQLQEAKT